MSRLLRLLLRGVCTARRCAGVPPSQGCLWVVGWRLPTPVFAVLAVFGQVVVVVQNCLWVSVASRVALGRTVVGCAVACLLVSCELVVVGCLAVGGAGSAPGCGLCCFRCFVLCAPSAAAAGLGLGRQLVQQGRVGGGRGLCHPQLALPSWVCAAAIGDGRFTGVSSHSELCRRSTRALGSLC